MKKCNVKDCKKKYFGKGYCSMHYWRLRKYGDPFKLTNIHGDKCKVKKCKNKYSSKGYCNNHYWQTHFKDKLFEILGGYKCMKCGFKDKRALQFDHKKGGGRNAVSKLGYRMMIIKYLKNTILAKKELQVLCANCNWIKKVTNKEHHKYYKRGR